MKLLPRLALVVLVTGGAVSAPATAGATHDLLSGFDPTELVEPVEDGFCEPVPGKRFVCLEIESTPDGPTAKACLYDETLKVLVPWFTGVGQLACVQSHHWAYLGTPGACFGTGPTGNPSGCIGHDRGFDDDGDGDIDRVKHCIVWVAGYSLCWT